MSKILIEVGVQTDGYNFRLSPKTWSFLTDEDSGAKPARGIFVGHDTHRDYQLIHGPMWDQVALLLTGLSAARLEELGGYEFVEAKTGKLLHKTQEEVQNSHVSGSAE